MGSCGDVDSQLLEQMPSVIVALDAHLDSAFQRCGNGFAKPLSFLRSFSHVLPCTENNLIIGCHVASILSDSCTQVKYPFQADPVGMMIVPNSNEDYWMSLQCLAAGRHTVNSS